MENRNGLIVGVDVRHATGTAERDGALELVSRCLSSARHWARTRGMTCVHSWKRSSDAASAPTSHATTNGRLSAIDWLMASGKGYAMSQQVRKRIEQAFGWVKTIGDPRKLSVVGLAKVRAWATWNFAAYNLIRIGGIGAWVEPVTDLKAQREPASSQDKRSSQAMARAGNVESQQPARSQ